MNIRRRIVALAAVMMFAVTGGAASAATRPTPEAMLWKWYGLMLELVRHTPTYSPPVAARAFAYVGITAFEASAAGSRGLVSLAGQLQGLEAMPAREAGAAYDEAVVINAALAEVMAAFFSNTGPTGQRAVAAATRKWTAEAVEGVAPDVTELSAEYGRQVAAHVLAWSRDDGGAVIVNMGFPYEFDLPQGPDKWVPTNPIVQQQLPLLPEWGNVRPFAMPAGSSCALPPPPAYSEDPGSDFYKEALEVIEAGRTLTPEQKAIARFWSDDPMLSTTPPGHWISIATQVAQRQNLTLADSVDLMARLGIAQADAFIGCWHEKYRYNLVRPITYIRRHIDPKWEPLLNTPPFPEYPSGHSTASGAAAAVLTAFFGEDFAFEDGTGSADGLNRRTHQSFAAAAEEAALSRLLGGIHFRSAIDRGLAQGRCIGAFAVALRTRT